MGRGGGGSGSGSGSGEGKKGGVPLCDECFYKASGSTCHACNQIIQGEVLNAEGHTWHPSCFACPDCGGLLLAGRYVMVPSADAPGKSLPMCEPHWLARHASPCAKCGLALDRDKVTLADKTYHPACLVCHYCAEPLVSKDGGSVVEVHRGPDEQWYCGKHQDGVCAYPHCTKSAWGPQDNLHKIANDYYCAEHYELASETFLPDACCRCGDAIRDGEGLQALGKWYHVPRVRRCFVCFVCGEPFANGEGFTILGSDEDREPVHARCMR